MILDPAPRRPGLDQVTALRLDGDANVDKTGRREPILDLTRGGGTGDAAAEQRLVHAGLITQRRLSRQVIYSAEYGTMSELLAYLTENCCGRGVSCVPVCKPADLFEGESDEASTRTRIG
jgi:hypothetical protein